MIRFVPLLVAALAVCFLPACAQRPGGVYQQQYQPRPQQGQYVRPIWQQPAPTPVIPPVDACQSRLYAGLVGQHEGAIYIPGLPGRKRILKPATIEDSDIQQIVGIDPDPLLVVVRDYIPDQSLYAPAIRTISDRLSLGPEIEERLTIELDEQGYVQAIRCA